MSGSVDEETHPGFSALEVHRARRAAGIPTITTLVGARDQVFAHARAFGLAEVVCEDRGPAALASAWVTGILRGRSAQQWIARAIARADDGTSALIERELARKTQAELPLYLERTTARFGAEAFDVVRMLLNTTAVGPDALHIQGPRELTAFLRGLHALYDQRLPSLLFAPATTDGLAHAAWLLAEVAQTLPSVTVSLAVDSLELDSLLRAPPDDRVRSLLIGGVIRIGSDLERATMGGTATVTSNAGCDLDQDARSAAEAFLHERLSSHPETKGVFELNGSIEIAALDGVPQLLEIDLLSRKLKLAIEIDGYHHFQEPERYRRDRRKDLLLQRAGFQVLRVLADDVVSRLEEILQTVVLLVRERRAQRRR